MTKVNGGWIEKLRFTQVEVDVHDGTLSPRPLLPALDGVDAKCEKCGTRIRAREADGPAPGAFMLFATGAVSVFCRCGNVIEFNLNEVPAK